MRRTTFATLLVSILIGACDAPPILFVASGAGPAERVTHMPLEVWVFAESSADPGSLRVTLNGTDITDDLDWQSNGIGEEMGWAPHLWGAPLVAGKNVLSARVAYGGEVRSSQLIFDAVGDPYADAVVSFEPGTNAGFGQADLPDVVLGPPQGGGAFQGGFDVLSLGLGGSIVLEFVDNWIADGPGRDFSVFENSFLTIGAGIVGNPFAESARVSVSQDGIQWFAFPCGLTPVEAPLFSGCAGVYPVLANALDPTTPHASIPTATPIEDLVGTFTFLFETPEGAGGDGFDLADVGLTWARFVRIEAAPFATPPAGATNAGFDLDAVAAVYSVVPGSIAP